MRNYEITIQAIPLEEGGGYCAYISELGATRCRADGETAEEAIKNLRGILEEVLSDYMRNSILEKE